MTKSREITSAMSSVIDAYQSTLRLLIDAETVPFTHDDLRTQVPENPGVYRIFLRHPRDEQLESVYIGESANLRDRLYGKHLTGAISASTMKKKLIKEFNLSPNENVPIRQFVKERCFVQWVIVESVRERIFFEHFAIAVLKPRLND